MSGAQLSFEIIPVTFKPFDRKEYSKEYYKKNKEKILAKQKEYSKKYYAENKKKKLSSKKKYYEENKEKLRAKKREYNKKNKEKLRAKHREYKINGDKLYEELMRNKVLETKEEKEKIISVVKDIKDDIKERNKKNNIKLYEFKNKKDDTEREKYIIELNGFGRHHDNEFACKNGNDFKVDGFYSHSKGLVPIQFKTGKAFSKKDVKRHIAGAFLEHPKKDEFLKIFIWICPGKETEKRKETIKEIYEETGITLIFDNYEEMF